VSVKQKLIEFLNSQPEDITSDEILDYILINDKIEAGIQAIEEGRFVTLEEARVIFKKWVEY